MMIRYRLSLALSAALLVPLGYALRFSSVLPEWFRNLSGNVAYETLLIVLLLIIVPKLKPIAAAITVCLISFGLEFLQLSQDPMLVAARSNRLGRLILGNGFTWEDFPLYVLGSLIGWGYATQLKRWIGSQRLEDPDY